jgi:hypothetical protein
MAQGIELVSRTSRLRRSARYPSMNDDAAAIVTLPSVSDKKITAAKTMAASVGGTKIHHRRREPVRPTDAAQRSSRYSARTSPEARKAACGQAELNNRDPMDAGRLHGDRVDAALCKPVHQASRSAFSGIVGPSSPAPTTRSRTSSEYASPFDAGRPSSTILNPTHAPKGYPSRFSLFGMRPRSSFRRMGVNERKPK